MGTNAVFSGFSAFSVTATNFMNSITFVMNHLISYFDISICHCSNRTLCYHLFKFHGFNYGYFLGGPRYIHLTTRTNAVFSSFSACFGYGDLLYEINHFCDESSVFLFRHFYMPLFQSDSLLPLFRFHGFNHGCFLEVTPIRFVTQKNSSINKFIIQKLSVQVKYFTLSVNSSTTLPGNSPVPATTRCP